MAINSQQVIESCMVVGFVGVQNIQRNISPVHINPSEYYTPVKYPGLLTEHAASEADCAKMIKIFTILFGVIIFIVQLIQVKPPHCMLWYMLTNYKKYNRFILHMLLALMQRDFQMVLDIIDCTLNKSKILKNPDIICLLFISYLDLN